MYIYIYIYEIIYTIINVDYSHYYNIVPYIYRYTIVGETGVVIY